MEVAAAQLRRILQLIPTLADDRDHPIDEVAARAGVTRGVLLRDLRSLADRFDDPGGFVEGVSILIDQDQVSVHASHFHRPMRLTRHEVAALELGLAMLRGERPPDEHGAIDRARERLGQVAAEADQDEDALLRTAEPLGPDAGEPEHRALIRSAIERSRKVRIDYQKAAELAAAVRMVCPYALVHSNGMWYLVAHCDGSGFRFFRMDRVRAVEPTDERFERTEPIPADVSAGGAMFRAEAAGSVTIRYSPRIARWIAEREGKELDAEGGLTMEHPCADADWAVRHVLQYGPDAEALAPPEIRDAVRSRLRAMVRAT